MIIGVDAGCLGIKDERLKVGVYQVAKNLFQQLEKQDRVNTYLLYSFYPIEKDLLKSFGKNVKNIIVRPVRGWTKIWLPLRLLRDKPDIFVGLNQSLPLKLPSQSYKSIVVIHDLLFEECPRMYPGSFRKLHRESKSAAKLADTILVPSNATKKDIEKFYKIPGEKIAVIHEGVRDFPKSAKYQILNTKYFLYVGALKSQKNVPKLLEAFGMINNQRSTTNKNIELLVVGGDKWKDKEIAKTFRKLPKEVKTRIKFLGAVDDAMLANLYTHTIAFVCPSLSEGFGLTFLEAMSLGTPVIGPKTGAVPEVVGDAGILIDPTSVKELTGAMEKMLDDKFRSSLQKKTQAQASKFSWEKFGQEFLKVLSFLR